MARSARVIAFYLPQFHEIPENNLWWGKGFTEWTNVVKARPLFSGHYQPREPCQDNYYELLDPQTFAWQIDLARQHGVGGFCFYHYWFKDGKKLLEQPVENYLANASYDFPFCLSWANEPWSRRWDGSEDEVLMPQDYGREEDWIRHFEYLLPFFRDSRYITCQGKPLILIYKPNLIPVVSEMVSCWRRLADLAGLPGLTFAWQNPSYLKDGNGIADHFDLLIEFEPFFSLARQKMHEGNLGLMRNLLVDIARIRASGIISLFHYIGRLLSSFLPESIASLISFPRVYDYRRSVTLGNDLPVYSPKSVPGVFTSWDNTARRGRKSIIFLNSSPSLFGHYLDDKLRRNRLFYDKDIIFVNAWNEWAEGAYLEPDKFHAYGYLRAIADSELEL